MQEFDREFQIKVIQDLNEFANLESEWNGLVKSCGRHVPFLCFDWFKIWLKHFLRENKLFILLVYRRDDLLAIAPFTFKIDKFKGMISIKKIELIGNFHSHVRNIILGNLSNDAKRLSLGALFHFLQNEYTDWDVIELDSMPEENIAFSILKEIIAEKGLKQREYFCFGDWFLDGIDSSGDEYLKKRSKNTRSGVRKKKRRMEKLGHLEFRVGTEEEKLDEYLALYEEVRGKSWKHPETDRAFLKESRFMAAKKQDLKFGFLFFNGSPIATLFSIISNNTAYLMEVVYDSEFDRFSPGEIIHGEFIKYLIDVDRITEVDALRGDEPYKESWTPQRRERRGILVFNKNIKGKFLAFMMARIFPVSEKNQYVLSATKRLVGYLLKHQHK
jgi:CelD/BcsL family acetyltransferase involved in cellulose biosynthesis